MSNDGGTYALEDTYDASQDIEFTFSLNPNGGQKGFGIYPALNGEPAGFDGVIIYEKDDANKTPVLSLGGNYSNDTLNPEFFIEEIEDANYPDHLVFKMADSGFSNERTARLIIKADKLENEKTYSLFFPKTIKTYNNGSPKQLGSDVTIEFSTAAERAAVQSWVTGDCTATLYDDGTFVVEAKEGTAGETEQNYSGTNMPPWNDSQYVEQIKKAEVKEGVTSIGKQFFSGCVNLSSVDLPDSLTSIGQQAFKKNISLERIVIPKKVTSLPRYVFSDCEKLSEVVLQEGFLTLERQWVNYTCKSLTSLTLPASVNNLPMQSLSIPSLKDVYINSKAEDITIHNNVCSYNGQKVAFHVKCDQLEAFNTKYPEGTFQASNVTSATFVGDIHSAAEPIRENNVSATCTTKGSYDEVVYCSGCHTELSRETKEVDKLAHQAADAVKENEVAATCTKEGSYDEVVYCKDCHTEMSRETKKVDKLAHTEEIVKGTPATCTEKGLTDGKKCSVCGEVLEAQKEIPAKGHTEEVIKGKAATCTEKGLTDGKKCSVCGEVLEAQKEIPAKDHTKADAVKENEVAATCTKEGSYDEVVYCKDCHTVLSRENKKVDKLAHTEEIVKGTPATCTKAGLTDGKKCSVCGEVLEAQKEIPAKGHTEEVIKGKAATCTEKGLTDGKKCSVCGMVLKVREDIPALGHDYKDGKCARCGETDPNYKPVDPVEPSDTKLVVKNVNGDFIAVRGTKSTTKASDYTGIAPEVNNRKVWWRVVNGDVVPNATGVFKNEYGWWRVENGTVNFKAQEIYKNQYGWWKTTNGKVTFDETGVFKNHYGWWRVEDSKVNFKANGIYKNQYGWWKTTKGKVTFKENGVFKNEYGWWKVEDSKVNFKFTGIAKNEYGTWYVKNGKVDFSKNGKVTYAGKTYQVTDGKAKLA